MSEWDDIMKEPGEQLRANCFEASHALAKLSYEYRAGNPWPRSTHLMMWSITS